MHASPSVQREELDGRPTWLLSLQHSAMLLCIGANDALLLPYWGPAGPNTHAADYALRLQRNRSSQREFLDGLPLAYPVYGDALFKDVCLVAAHADGRRETRFAFVEDRISVENNYPVLDLVFEDAQIGLRLKHRFQLFVELDLVARSVMVENRGTQPVVLERLLTAALPLPSGSYDAWSLHGQWGREFQLTQRLLGPGKVVLESRRGLSSAEAHPWFAVGPHGEHSEDSGPVWFGSLCWSGNWMIALEVEPNDALHIVAGLQPFDFAWRLEPGDQFTAPELVCGYSDSGLDAASRQLHDFETNHWLPANLRERPRPVLYNSWEATNFDVRVEQQIELARKAATIGIELFVVDDGWFGERHHDRAALGDWTVNANKFPHGLREVIDEVHRLGMQFGIWVEPEMVNPDSHLYRAHPDWAYHVDGRDSTYGRNQLVLNFARDDVREYITRQLRRLLSDHGSIEFVKWDHNRAWTEVGWPEQPDRQREVWVRHVLGLYEMLATLRREFPHVMFESCASGGGRADLGMLRWTDQVWTSDNTDAADRLDIQYGYSRAHAPRVMVNWVTDVPNQQTGRVAPLEFRFHVAMQGVLGIGGHIGKWSEPDLEVAARIIGDYKALRPLIQFGDQHWLVPPAPTGPAVVQYVTRTGDRTVVFYYQLRGRLGAGVRRVRLRGLNPDLRYRRDVDGVESTGAVLMTAGIPAEVVDSRNYRPSLDWRSDYQVWSAV